jgi:hypothetical protein
MADLHGRPELYSDMGPLAVGARLSCVMLVIAIVGASLIPPTVVPRFLGSLHLEHFAAFYLLALATAAASPRTQLRKILVWLVGFAVVLEAVRVLIGARSMSSIENLFADIGGMWSALVPIVIGRFRGMFAQRRTVASTEAAQ